MAQNPSYRTVDDYCQIFSNLNVSRKRGAAPYKPLLLLSVIDLIGQGVIQENKIYVSQKLIDTFTSYWNILSPEYKGGLHYPFIHLQSDGFWYVVFQENHNGLQPKTTNKLKNAVQYAQLDDRLFESIQYEETRKLLVDTLIGAWFISTNMDMENIIEINQVFQKKSDNEAQNDDQKSNTPKYSIKKSVIRNAFFRKSVTHLYNYECALCKMKVTKSLTQHIVEGAHIKPFSLFYDNAISNGIAFCKNHHWAFDRGLFSINNDFCVIVSEHFSEQSPNNTSIQDFRNQIINLPESELYYPSREALSWHKDNIFLLG